MAVLWAAAIVMPPFLAPAQTPLPELVFTAATTAKDGAGRFWGYLVIDATTPAVLAGRTCAVYMKAGDPASPDLYRRAAILQRQSDPRAIKVLLSRAAQLGDDLQQLDEGLSKLFEAMTNVISLPLEQKISAIIRGSGGNADYETNLRLMAKSHPGLAMCLGLAHAELLNGPVGGTSTFEVREHDPARGEDLAAIGRVILRHEPPVALPAPGAPVRVPERNARGHLNAKLRWATPDALRRVSLLNHGFNVWRVTRAAAEARNWTNNPPESALLVNESRKDPSIRLVNRLPALKTRDFSETGALDLTPETGDPLTSFVTDDNNRFYGGLPFADGDEFYYYVTARDILGRDGKVSRGTRVMLCSLLPPDPPTDVRVSNEYSYTPGEGGKQVLKVTWRQSVNNPGTDPERPSTNIVAYWVYRWTNQVEMNLKEKDSPANRIAVVPHVEGGEAGFHVDDGPGSPSMVTQAGRPSDVGRTFWYTVRAQDGAACGSNLSPHSGMADGVLRDRVGPQAPTGGVELNCASPVAQFVDFLTGHDPDPDLLKRQFLVRCMRQHAQLAWAEFRVEVSASTLIAPSNVVFDLGRIEFGSDGEALTDYSLPEAWSGSPVKVSCRVGISDQSVSPWAEAPEDAWPAVGARRVLLFTGRIDVSPTLVLNPTPTAVRLSPPVLFSLPPFIPERYVVLYTHGVPGGDARVQTSADLETWTDLGNVGITTINIPFIGSFGPLIALKDPALFSAPRRFYRALATRYLPPPLCEHFPYAGNNATATRTGIGLRVDLTPTTKEYKIYRRVDDGPLSLLAQGRGDYDAGLVSTQRVDEALPFGAVNLCYFAQVFDEHGNPSPLVSLGECVKLQVPPPCPVLSSIESLVGNAAPRRARLHWACPPQGVQRFEIHLGSKQGDTSALDNPGVQTCGGGNGSPKFQTSSRLDPGGQVVRPEATYPLRRCTDLVGGSIGSGPEFSMEIDVREGVKYFIRVVAISHAGIASADCGKEREFTWQAPPALGPQVAWPARPLPATQGTDKYPVRLMPILAFETLPVTNLTLLDPVHPVGVKIGQVEFRGLFPRPRGHLTNSIPHSADPISHLFPPPNSSEAPQGPSNRETILPVVLYRTQVANSRFPRVSGDILQCSPLVEKIAYSPGALDSVVIRDPFVRPLYRQAFPHPSDATIRYVYSDLFLLDTQPVVAGASYEYLLVRLDPKTHEIDQTLSVGTVTIPES